METNCIDEYDSPVKVGVLCEEVIRMEPVLVVSPLPNSQTLVEEGDMFTVSSSKAGKPLSEFIRCSVFDFGDGIRENPGTGIITPNNVTQTVFIGTQENTILRSTFGSFELMGCNAQQCMQTLTYTYSVTNVGDPSMPNGGPPFFLEQFMVQNDLVGPDFEDFVNEFEEEERNIAVGQSTSYSFTYDPKNICNLEQTFDATLQVEGNEGTCQAETTFELTFVPECDSIALSLECFYVDPEDGEEIPCSEIKRGVGPVRNSEENPRQCNCADNCVTELQFRVTGGRCSDRVEGVPANDWSCTDFMSSPGQGDIYTMILSEEGSMYYNDYIAIGDEITLSSSECISEKFAIYSASDMFFSRMFQAASCGHHCSADEEDLGLNLNDNVGTFQFTGYSCANGFSSNGQGPPVQQSDELDVSIDGIPCLQNVTYVTCLSNDGLVPISINEWKLTTNSTHEPSQEFMLTSGVPTLEPFETICENRTAKFWMCGEGAYEALSNMIADDEDPACSANAPYVFEYRGGTPNLSPFAAPTVSPTETASPAAPVPTPTQSPVTPNFNPFPRPSQPPVVRPTTPTYSKFSIVAKDIHMFLS